MKKFFIIIFISIISLNFAFWYNPVSSDKLIVNKIVSKLSSNLSQKSQADKKKIKTLLYSIINQNKSNQRIVYLMEETLKKLSLFEFKNEYSKHYKDNYINYDYVKNTWISRHDEQRKLLNLWNLENKSILDNTAYEWSKEQSFRQKMSHERNIWDWFYNYPIIENWFQDRLVKCKVADHATSSESIAHYWYYCYTRNCNDQMLESLKEIFDIYMNEKWLSYPANAHYKSIVFPAFTQVWFWLYIKKEDNSNYYDYYISTHYCTELTY